MKKRILFFLLLLPVFAFCQQTFEIKGTLKEVEPGAKVFISYFDSKKLCIDSSRFTNGSFSFTGTISGAVKAYLQMMHIDKETHKPSHIADYISIYLEPGTIYLETDAFLKYAKVSGSPINNMLQQFRDKLVPLQRQQRQLQDAAETAASNGNTDTADSLQRASFNAGEEIKKVQDDFILSQRNTVIGFAALKSYVDDVSDADRAIRLFDKMSDPIRNSPEGKIYNASLSDARKMTVGVTAPLFTLPDTLGKMVSLSSCRNQYVLVDFWASWCMPCRAENPNLVKVHNLFKNKNIRFISISLDGGGDSGAREKWLNAIKKDQLRWQQLSDLQGMKSKVALSYNISSIPANFLIAPNGKIVARDLKGPALEKMLSQLL